MDKRQRHNLLLILAIIILLLGVASQVYLMVTSGEGAEDVDRQPATGTTEQPQ